MTTIQKHIISFLIAGALTIGLMVGLLLFREFKPVYGSVSNMTDGYYSTTTPYAGQINGTGGVVLLKGSTTVGVGNFPGLLGSVVVTGGPKAGTIALYDATTSNVNLRTGGTSSSTILIAEFPAGVASSTYVFDVNFNTGLLLVTTGSVSTSTITWK